MCEATDTVLWEKKKIIVLLLWLLCVCLWSLAELTPNAGYWL
jgi:hypothetical protein